MKTLWIVNQYAIKPSEPGGTRHAGLAKYLARQGWDCHIIAGSIIPHKNTHRLSARENHRIEKCGDFQFLWLRNTPYSGNYIQRVWSMLVFTWRLLTSPGVTTLPRPDVVLGSTVHPLAAWAALRLAKKHGVPFIFEIRDLWPEAQVQTGMLSARNPLARAMYKLEAHLCREAESVVYTMRGAEAYLREKGVPAHKLRWVTNGVDLEFFPEPGAASADEVVRFFFVGSLVPIVALDKVIDGWALVEQRMGPSCPELHFIGEGPLKQPLIERCRERGLQKVFFHPGVAKEEVPQRCREATAFVLTAQDLPGLYKYGISQNKMYDYLAMGKPVLMFSGMTENIVTESGAGISILSLQPHDVADGFIRMSALSAAERSRLGQLGRQHLETHYSHAVLADKLADLLAEVVADPRHRGRDAAPARPNDAAVQPLLLESSHAAATAASSPEESPVLGRTRAE